MCLSIHDQTLFFGFFTFYVFWDFSHRQNKCMKVKKKKMHIKKCMMHKCMIMKHLMHEESYKDWKNNINDKKSISSIIGTLAFSPK